MRRIQNKNNVYRIPDIFINYGRYEYIAGLPANYVYNLLVSHYSQEFLDKKKINVRSRPQEIFKYVRFHTADFIKLSKEFDDYAKENAWIREYYDMCVNTSDYMENPFGDNPFWIALQRETPESLQAKKFLNEKFDYERFFYICRNFEHINKFNELKREIPSY